MTATIPRATPSNTSDTSDVAKLVHDYRMTARRIRQLNRQHGRHRPGHTDLVAGLVANAARSYGQLDAAGHVVLCALLREEDATLLKIRDLKRMGDPHRDARDHLNATRGAIRAHTQAASQVIA